MRFTTENKATMNHSADDSEDPASWYVLELKKDNDTCFLLWKEGDVEVVATTEQGSLRVFESLERASSFAASRGLELAQAEPWEFDFSNVIEQLNGGQFPANIVMEAWNLLVDVKRSLGESYEVEDLELHEKVFYACNVLAPKGEHYEPEWSRSERAKLLTYVSSLLDLVGLEP